MKKILLLCAAGMSTSLLVAKMQKSADDQNMDVEVMFKAAGDVQSISDAEGLDVVMLGPQVRYMKDKFEEMLAPEGIAVAVIDMSDYGMMKGEKVLKTALELIEE